MPPEPLIESETAAVREDEAAANRAWRIDRDGRFFERKNGPDATRPPDAELFWFESDYAPAERIVPESALRRIEAYVESLSGMSAYERKETPGLEGGSWHRLTLHPSAGLRVLEVDSPERGRIDRLLKPVFDILSEAMA